jgi:AcrR family transcriptional regulator
MSFDAGIVCSEPSMERSTAEGGMRPRRPGRIGRPPLTERRKAATRLEIAREAVRLFTTTGVAGTSAEEVAAASGISVRTLWRYFPSKESCVLPLLTTGIEAVVGLLRAWPPGQEISPLLDRMESVGEEVVVDVDVPTLVSLVRLTRSEPALRAVWMHAHDEAEPAFAAALAARAGEPMDSLRIRVQAATINGALRAAVEHYAWSGTPAGPETSYRELIGVIRAALLAAADGLEG